MRKKMMKIVLLALAMAGILFACRHEFDEPVINQALTVNDAQVWYEANKPGNLMLKSGKEGVTEKAVKPNWENATKYESENMEIVETILMTQGGLGFFTAESKAEWEVSKNPGYISSTTKLVIQKNKKTGESLGFIMTLVGEKNCQEKKGFDLSKSRYLKIEDDFSGLVLFHDLEGNFVNGWRYTEGKVTRSVSALSFENAPQLKLKVAITNCITYDVYYWEQNCTDWWSVTYVDGAEVSRTYSRTTCGSQYMVYGGSYTECLTTGTTSGTYGGGGGGGTTTPQQSQTPTADKIIATNKNLTGDQMKLFENSLKQFINENCGSKAVYNALINNGFKVNIEMKGTLENSAAYNPVSGTLYFKNNDALQSSYALREELAHAFQDNFYPGGTDRFAQINGINSAGYSQIEFEAKVIVDLGATGCCSMFSNNTVLRQQYLNWIIQVKENGFVINDNVYKDLLIKFNNNHAEYSSPLLDELFSHPALNSIKSSFCNLIN